MYSLDSLQGWRVIYYYEITNNSVFLWNELSTCFQYGTQTSKIEKSSSKVEKLIKHFYKRSHAIDHDLTGGRRREGVCGCCLQPGFYVILFYVCGENMNLKKSWEQTIKNFISTWHEKNEVRNYKFMLTTWIWTKGLIS